MAKIQFNLPPGTVPASAGPQATNPVIETQPLAAQPQESPTNLAAQIAALQAQLDAQKTPKAITPAPNPSQKAPAEDPAPVTPPNTPAPAPKAKKSKKGACPTEEYSAPAPAPVPAPTVSVARPAPVVASVVQTQLPAVVPKQPVGATIALDDTAENIDFSDLVLPRINIVQKVGDLSQRFEPGALVLGKTIELDRPVTLAVMAFGPKRFVEKVPGGQTQGRIVKTEAEVVTAGGTLDYAEAEEREIPLFQRLATALIVLRRGEDDAIEGFPFKDATGNDWALAFWSMKGTAYTHAAKHIFTARKIGVFKTGFSKALRQGYLNQLFTLDTEAKKFGSNWAVIPVLGLGAETSDEFKAFVRNMLAVGASESGAADEA